MRHFSAVALLLVSATPLVAQQREAIPSLAAIADSVFSRWSSTHSPGCAVGVAREGNVLLRRGYGMANLETGTPITGETIFESGSVAKQFTATAVVLLAMDGKLDLADPVRTYFPEMPEYDRPITIRHLLTHTSGLREWSNLVAVAGWPRGQRAHTQDDLIDVVFRQKALNYPVGDHYSYTNSGYAIAKTLRSDEREWRTRRPIDDGMTQEGTSRLMALTIPNEDRAVSAPRVVASESFSVRTRSVASRQWCAEKNPAMLGSVVQAATRSAEVASAIP